MLHWIEAIIAPGVRMSSPLILASMGCLFNRRAGNYNIALESYMLFASFFGVWIGSLTGSIWVALLAAIAASTLSALLMALLVLRGGADEIVVGLAMNLGAGFLTSYLLESITSGGGFMATRTHVPIVVIPFVDSIPIVGQAVSRQDIFVYVSWLSVFLVSFLVKNTQLGLQIRAAGDDPDSAAAAGVNVEGMRYICFGLSGLLGGLAGFQLAVSFLQLFSNNMVAGRGIISFAAVIFGRGIPLYTTIAALIFGFAQAIANQLSTVNLPPQFILMIPYLFTIASLFFAAVRKQGRRGVS